ncbi:phosphate ABC transporter substrate-binding protein PstS [Micromonospora sp. WMMD1082]|uniref:phosphate ABC transporter substrate-binding protein PstS n=1 Tax=Micromonospora sp. WMMD1082 TaxID=3016104 RepID=UPI00241644F2|nr:phosphate ABC transporter substrate-binding protein PstS [Micromonospora sp. WMMD1082]MDG4795280.1 phosphate ABC transporter substrate-binding protein PstS [Micromonospora sp. WMMD1082]
MVRQRIRRPARLLAVAAVVALLGAVAPPASPSAQAAKRNVRIVGIGSTWSANAVAAWAANVQANGLEVQYEAAGSTQGRTQFREGKAHFGVSEIPYGLSDAFGGTDSKGARPSGYMPIVAGGTAFMYNLKINGRRVTNLRLSGENIAKIFTGVITRWNDPAIRADNPGLNLPARTITPVVRQDGSGTTAQFTLWMSKEHPAIWNTYCRNWNKPAPCGITSTYPRLAGMIGATGSDGVSGKVRQDNAEGAITYVEYSYALNARFPVVRMLNRAGYYVEPTARNVAVALTEARIKETGDPRADDYLTQILDSVYRHTDPRSYPLSSYSYMVLPVGTGAEQEQYAFTADHGETLGKFAYYFLCEGQPQAEVLGYSPLPVNLVRRGMEQVQRIPGAEKLNIDRKIATCNNPTVSPDGGNALARNAPQPSPCDRRGPTQNPAGTAGATQQTPVLAAAACTTGGGSVNPGGSASPGGGTASPGATAAPGTTAPGAGGPGSGPGGPGAVPTAGAPPVVDPDTGEVIGVDDPAGGGGGDQAAAVPVSLAGEGGWRLQHTMMLLAALLLLGLVVAPPLLANALQNRHRTDDRWSDR